MARHRKRKHSWNPYTSEIQRLSIYPRIQAPRDDDKPKVGDIVEVIVSDMDSKGRGIASYRGYKIIVYNAGVGSKVKARITKIAGDSIYAEVISTISESSVEY
ncbi:TRAM domain-containing protein [Desulfurococcaceae archaeon MEX13E-LK6-19]|nr:TRAM domain-containing protein [Desulfurococcaceae archaeon MEX13E-LK6-19]